ncbi:hypothetical protein FQR65_LT01112 [Abscondita terminalis]|nr:hypothetical protein FQR65_LT01112 [Abscondita terminalis]
MSIVKTEKYPLPPKEAGKFIANQAKHVKIKDEGIERLGDKILQSFREGKLSVENFSQSAVHPKASDPKAIDWLFVVDTLNFCFWHNEDEEGWVVDKYTGYFALCAAINRAIKEGIDITNPSFYSTMTKEQLQHILRSDTKVEVPLLNERLECLHSVGKTLIEKFEGSFKKCVEEADNSAMKLLDIIVDNFQCFQDEAFYISMKICIYKRAQILIGDIWACFQGKGLGKFNDIYKITMFADYAFHRLYYILKCSNTVTN